MIKLFLVFLLSVVANAHSLKVFADEDSDFVVIKSYFYGNSPCNGCNVDIIKDGKIIQNTKTDENGTARVKLMMNEFDILVDGSLAHEKRITFSTDKNITIANQDDSDLTYTIKIISCILGLIIFFGILYFIKRK